MLTLGAEPNRRKSITFATAQRNASREICALLYSDLTRSFSCFMYDFYIGNKHVRLLEKAMSITKQTETYFTWKQFLEKAHSDGLSASAYRLKSFSRKQKANEKSVCYKTEKNWRAKSEEATRRQSRVTSRRRRPAARGEVQLMMRHETADDRNRLPPPHPATKPNPSHHLRPIKLRCLQDAEYPMLCTIHPVDHNTRALSNGTPL
ncbi:hypothetical protein LSTR_LSTR008595 [Laodelphax striatellus]|uniref:Uncharacterized protein n=1 Tax=Laodelphax striatellus TaxID=195883 RepID=A0A482WVB9_LAOST|nr:hypothetical protein LSTR_LSTR008595 [Laodelphax striatellus]